MIMTVTVVIFYETQRQVLKNLHALHISKQEKQT